MGRNGSIGLGAAFALGLAGQAGAALGDPIWKFFADFSVTVLEPIPDATGNGGMDVLVGSGDDSLYLVEARGAGAGNQIWSSAFRSTVSAVVALPDLDGDGKAEAAAGDELGLISVLGGADGKAHWKFLTFGTVLSLAALPDADGDGTPDLGVGSENDTVYCLSGKPGSALGKSIWQFAAPGGKKPGPPAAPPKGGAAEIGGAAKIAAPPAKDGPVGANALSWLRGKDGAPFGLAVGTSVDTVYCLGLANGAVLWKTGLPGDIWKTAAFPDQDGDGVEEVLLACGADAGYLLSGATGAVIWSHAVSMGATAVAVAPDMDGDGKPDALIGDGNGTVHCVPGVAKGAGAKAAWTYAFGDTSTITSLAALGDLDKDGRAECAVGTSGDTAAILSGKGLRLFAAGLGGQVNAVAAMGDIDGNGAPDWIAGTEMGFAQALSGSSSSVLVRLPSDRQATLKTGSGSARVLFAAPGRPLQAFDGTGRLTAPKR